MARRVFALLGGVQLFLLLDMAFDWRWKLHNIAESLAAKLGVYGERHVPQVLMLILLSVVVAGAAVWIFLRFRKRPGMALAVIGTLLSVGLCCCEAISLHFMDAILYHMVGNVMRVGLLWISFAVLTCLGVWFDGRRDIFGPAKPQARWQ